MTTAAENCANESDMRKMEVVSERTGFLTLENLPIAATAAASGPTRILDGDITIDGTRTRVRLVTPETHRARCANELTLGRKATERLRVR